MTLIPGKPKIDLTDTLKESLKQQILENFPERKSCMLGGVSCVFKTYRWVLIVSAILFSESGSGRDITATFEMVDLTWKIFDYAYDY